MSLLISILKIFFISSVPLIEQRMAIPVGIFFYKVNPLITFLISYLGSLLPVPFILLLFNYLYNWMKKYNLFKGIVNIIDNKIRKNQGKLEKYKELGLITFVAIPLPTTGLWTGSIIAAFLGLDFKKSLICTAIGGLISAMLITLISLIFPAMLGY